MPNYPLPAITRGCSGYWEKWDDFQLFPLKLCISLYIYKKSVAPLLIIFCHITPLLAKLELARQFL
jgi:hypothetical protein